MKVFGRTGVRIYHAPIKVRIKPIDLIGLDTECAWRGGQNVNMDLLTTRSSSKHIKPKEARVRFGFGSAGSKSLVWR